jgi:hypothetical protein
VRTKIRLAAGCLARFLAFLCAILFVIATVSALFLFTTGHQLLSPGIYKQALREQDIYARFPALAADVLASSQPYRPCAAEPQDPRCQGEGENDPAEAVPGGPPAYLAAIERDDWEAVLAELVSPAWIQAQTESVFDQLFPILLGTRPSSTVVKFSLVELKSRLRGEPGMRAIRRLISAQPPCTPDQLARFSAEIGSISEAGELLGCHPPEAVLEEMSPIFVATLDKVVEDIPDQASFSLRGLDSAAEGEALSPAPESQPSGGPSGGLYQLVRVIRWVTQLSPLLPAAFLLLVTLFGVRSRKGWLRWWGIPFLIAGGLACGCALAALPAANQFLFPSAFGENSFASNLPPNIIEEGYTLARFVIWRIGRLVAVEAAILACTGALMFGASFLGRVRPESALQAAPEAEGLA